MGLNAGWLLGGRPFPPQGDSPPRGDFPPPGAGRLPLASLRPLLSRSGCTQGHAPACIPIAPPRAPPTGCMQVMAPSTVKIHSSSKPTFVSLLECSFCEAGGGTRAPLRPVLRGLKESQASCPSPLLLGFSFRMSPGRVGH